MKKLNSLFSVALTLCVALSMILTPAITRAQGAPSNLARTDAGATVTVSSTHTSRNYDPRGAIDGDRKGLNWEQGGGWSDGSRAAWPDHFQITFSQPQTISRVVVANLQDNFNAPVEPTADTPATLYNLVDYDVQAFDGKNWITVASKRGNARALNDFSFAPVTTRALRLHVLAANGLFSRTVEMEAYGAPPQ